MSQIRRGFTLIEVSFFLAISGLLFVGIAVGVQNSVYRQRYNDSVQSFAEFLRGVYAEVLNVQSSDSGGRTNRAIYGKLVTFGENAESGDDSNRNTAYVYDVAGKATTEISNGGIIGILGALEAGVVDGDNNFMGIVESYTPKWEAKIEKTDAFTTLKGSLLVVRHPRSGTVHTFYAEDFAPKIFSNPGNGGEFRSNLSNFKSEQVDFCIATADQTSGHRMDVRIKAGATGAAGIEVIDDNGNECDK